MPRRIAIATLDRMCGRFTLRLTPAELQEFFDLIRVPQFTARYNISPGTPILCIKQAAEGRIADFALWGHWNAKPGGLPLPNARAESVFTRRSFSDSARHRRCLIPVQGFYEWQEVSKTRQQPYHFSLKSDEPMAFAAVYDESGGVAAMTVAPNAEVATVMDRMAVILPPAAWEQYLDPGIASAEAIQPLLTPLPEGLLTMYPCDPIVNNVKNETPDCIRRVTPPVRSVQKSLFGDLTL
jgi:putative SOS response-associated peptidase YedK